MICENCRVRPASVQVSRQQGGQRTSAYLCTQCARELGMIGGGDYGGANPFEMLHNLIQQQNQGPGSFSEHRGDPGDKVYTFTPSAKRALQLAFTAARQMGAAQVGSEHLLLGLLGGGDGNAYRIWKQHGASDAEALRR